MYLLDTNVVLELRRLDRADENVRRWSQRIAGAELFLSAITIMEIEIGILRIERRDPSLGAKLRAWLETGVLVAFGERVLAIDLAVARRCAALHIPDPRSERDAMVAATALVHGMTVVTGTQPISPRPVYPSSILGAKLTDRSAHQPSG